MMIFFKGANHIPLFNLPTAMTDGCGMMLPDSFVATQVKLVLQDVSKG